MLTEPSTPSARGPSARAIVAGLLLLKLGLHLALITRYAYHRDELYFIDCGAHLAFGYVDHPPLVPWIAYLAGIVFDHSLFGLRLLPALAGTTTVWLTVLIVRRFGGGRFAQGLAGLCIIIAPAYLRMGIMLNIVVFEPLFWTLASYLVLRILQGDDERLWLLVGAVAGFGLLNKHTMLLWGGGIVVGLMLTPQRRVLRSPWAWAGGALALAVFAPNLAWQAGNDWATYEFLTEMSQGALARIPRSLFVLGQLLYMHPFAALVWLPGLVWLLASAEHPYRPFGLLFVFAFGVFLVTHAKPYYLAAAYPVLLAAGAVSVERKLARRRGLRAALVATLAAAGLALGIISLPILPLPAADAALGTMLGRVVPPTALTHDLHDEYGWPEMAASVGRVYAALPRDQRDGTAIVTGNYGQAAAINFFGPRHGLPRAVSGHLAYYLWGPQAHRPERVIAVGLDDAQLTVLCAAPQLIARHQHEMAMERDVPIFLCRTPAPLGEVWPRLKRYRHGLPDLAPSHLANHGFADPTLQPVSGAPVASTVQPARTP